MKLYDSLIQYTAFLEVVGSEEDFVGSVFNKEVDVFGNF